MILILILIIACSLAGGAALWFSGYLFRTAATPPASLPLPMPASDGIGASEQVAALERQLAVAAEERRGLEFAARQAVEEKVSLDEEVARLNVELGQLENDKANREAEVDRLHQELEKLKEEIDGSRGRIKPPKLPQPSTAASHHESEAVDTIAAQLDLERVAHQKTREELEQLKKTAAATPAPAPPEKRSFPTMAFGFRPSLTGLPTDGDDAMKKSLEKLQAEKDDIEARLTKAQQEIQILRMRQSQ